MKLVQSVVAVAVCAVLAMAVMVAYCGTIDPLTPDPVRDWVWQILDWIGMHWPLIWQRSMDAGSVG